MFNFIKKRIKKNLKIIHINDIMKIFNHSDTLLATTDDLLIYDSIKNNSKKSFSNHLKNRKKQLIEYRKILNNLKKLPFIKQRTIEWFNARKNRLTASDLGDAIKENNIKLAKQKAGIVKNNTNFATIPALKWGTMFEAMAMRCYSQERNDIDITEFGLIEDKNNEHFGASPDGINDMGIMIEIKCPFSRVIKDNNVPEKYYMQIQGQLAVCGLNECDYVECCFATHDSVYKYIESCEGNVNHGIIAEYENISTNEYEYLYSDAYLTAANALDNINKQIFEYKHDTEILKFNRLIPWNLKQINVQRVLFDPELWQKTVPKINNFWEKVEQCKLCEPEEQKAKLKKYSFVPDDEN